MGKGIKDLTKSGNWQTTSENPTREDLHLSCLMRIADATELMATNYIKIQEERDRFWKWYQEESAENKKLKLSVIAHKAAFTRLKNKYKNAKAETEKED